MNILAFDTVSSSFSMALKRGDSIVEINKEKVENHNREILPSLDALLKENKISLNDIEYAALGIGPGSFTAVRISLATIKSVCYAKNIPIIGISSLEALYQNIKSYGGIKLALIDARKGSAYASVYKDGDKIKENLDATYEEILEIIKNLYEDKKYITLCGDGFGKNKDFFIDNLKNYELNRLDDSFNVIKASNLISLSENRYKNKDFDDIFSLRPLYIRKSEAENRKPDFNKKS